MINQTRKPRKLIGTRNGLKIYTSLKKKPINKISKTQKNRLKTWAEITEQKISDLNNICQWCGKLGLRKGTLNFLSGHHIKKRRYRIDTYENCYISHWITCHQFIEEHNINVLKYPNLKVWESRNG